MGGMISLKLASKHADRVSGLLLVAPAVNRLKSKFAQWREEVAKEDGHGDRLKRLDAGEVVVFEVKNAR